MNTYERLREFWRKYYSAHYMTLTVQSRGNRLKPLGVKVFLLDSFLNLHKRQFKLLYASCDPKVFLFYLSDFCHTGTMMLISSAETLDTLEEWVREIFIKVPNK